LGSSIADQFRHLDAIPHGRFQWIVLPDAPHSVGDTPRVMPEESTTPDLVELMGKVVEAFNRSDVDTLMSFFAADAVFESPVLGTSFEGVAAICTFAEDWLGAFEEWAVEPEEIIDMGKGVVFVVYRQEGRPV
jgi:hypothetical protein